MNYSVKEIAAYLVMSEAWVYGVRNAAVMKRSSMPVIHNLALKSRLKWTHIVTMSGEQFLEHVTRVMKEIEYGISENDLRLIGLREELQGKSMALKYVDPKITSQLAVDVRALENKILELEAA